MFIYAKSIPGFGFFRFLGFRFLFKVFKLLDIFKYHSLIFIFLRTFPIRRHAFEN